MEEVTLLIVDDHRLVRAGLKNLIENIGSFRVVGEGASGSEAVVLVESHNPDICLLDISMPGMSGIETLARIKDLGGKTRVVMLSMHDGAEYVTEALRAGADGYLIKDSAESELEIALRSVIDDQIYLSPRVSRHLVTAALSGKVALQKTADDSLTTRQQEILRLMADGKATKEIAWELNVSTKTVESHRSQIMTRLKIRDMAGLLRYAFTHGLAEL